MIKEKKTKEKKTNENCEGRAPIAHLGMAIHSQPSGFFPLCEGHELVHDFLQPLQSPFLIGSSNNFLATLQVEAVRFADFSDFFSQFSHALFNGLLHTDRLAEVSQPWWRFVEFFDSAARPFAHSPHRTI